MKTRLPDKFPVDDDTIVGTDFTADDGTSIVTNVQQPPLDDETSQQWILRHLKKLLAEASIDEEAVTDFVLNQDITAFRNFILHHSYGRYALFLTIERNVVPLQSNIIDADAILSSHLAAINAAIAPEIHVMRQRPGDNSTKNDLSKRRKSNRADDKETDLDKKKDNVVAKESEKLLNNKSVASIKQKKSRKKKRAKSAENDSNGKTDDSNVKKSVPKRDNSKKRKQRKENGEAVQQEAAKSREQSNKEILQELVQQEFSALHGVELTETQIVLSWFDQQKIPNQSEFVYILTRYESEPSVTPEKPEIVEKTAVPDEETGHSEFDNLYYVGYCNDRTVLANVLKNINAITKKDLDFEHQMNILVYLLTPSDQTPAIDWTNKENKFETFIHLTVAHSEKVIQNQKHAAAVSSEITGSVDFIENLLRTHIVDYVRNPNAEFREQLILELSLYELRFIGENMFSTEVISCLQRTFVIFSVIQIFYLKTDRDWIHKAVFHSIELSVRILATNVQQRLWNLVGDNCENSERLLSIISDEEHRLICREVRPLLLEFIQLGYVCMNAHTDEFNCLDKIKQCLKIVDFIEEDFSKLVALLEDLRDPKRDMAFDRTALDAAVQIVRQIWNNFEENFFESSLESGNFEAMKNIYLQLSQHLVDLNATIPPLNKYCT